MRKPCNILVQIDGEKTTGYVVRTPADGSSHGLLFVAEREGVDDMVKAVCRYLHKHDIVVEQYGIAIGRKMTATQACKAVHECARIMQKIASEREVQK